MSHRPDGQTIRRWIKICAFTMAVLMLRVWENVRAQTLERELKSMRLEADRLSYENGKIEQQIHQYEAPSNLEMLAKKNGALIPLDAAHRVGIQP